MTIKTKRNMVIQINMDMSSIGNNLKFSIEQPNKCQLRLRLSQHIIVYRNPRHSGGVENSLSDEQNSLMC